jgi:hypothetical protein
MAIMNLKDHEIRSVWFAKVRRTDLRCYSDPLAALGMLENA